MTKEEYLASPCQASSLSFYKTLTFDIPENILVIRDDLFSSYKSIGEDEPYFKLIHYLKNLEKTNIPSQYVMVKPTLEEICDHINKCYEIEGISLKELELYQNHKTYDSDLLIALKDKSSGQIVASGIGEFDDEIKEGTLDWIQVSPSFRRLGLAKIVVNELLNRLKAKANFVTVSGKMNNFYNPRVLYIKCGFENEVIWHIITKK